MQMLENLLSELKFLLVNGGDPHTLQAWEYSPLLQEHEVLQATYALLAQRHRLKPFQPKIVPLKSGAVPLFNKSFFPWGGLPYPKEHAELGALLFQLNDQQMKKMAKEMLPFQDATLDHNKKPIFSFFRQENSIKFSCIEEANKAFFSALSYEPSDVLQFSDSELGLISRRDENTTILCLGSGCKSGNGIFLYQDAGIVNWGPQLLPLHDCEGFGIAGKAQDVSLQNDTNHFFLSFLNRLSSPSSRKTDFEYLKDSGYSGIWMKGEVSGNNTGISIRCFFDGFFPLNRVMFSFFGKAEACLIAGSHKLNPHSLDRYQGPPQRISFFGNQGGVQVDSIEGARGMEVIPLAGDESFWGADFLVAYTLSSPNVSFALSLKKNN